MRAAAQPAVSERRSCGSPAGTSTRCARDLQGSSGWCAVGPDVLCLQETKARNDAFPGRGRRGARVSPHALHGQAAYHGVAVFAKLPFEDAAPIAWCGRRIAAICACLAISNCTISTCRRRAHPDPEINAKFAHKLEFLAALTDWFALGLRSDATRRARGRSEHRAACDRRLEPTGAAQGGHAHAGRIAAWTSLQAAHRLDRRCAASSTGAAPVHLVELSRPRLAGERRPPLDHIWVTPSLADRLRGAQALAARGWPQPSDHVPVTIDLDANETGFSAPADSRPAR